MKNKNDGRNAEKFFWAFEDVFWKFSSRWLPRTGSGQIQRKTKNPVFITILGLKDCGGFKGRRAGCHDIRWYRSRFLQTLVVIFPQKSTQVKVHTKMAMFRLVFSVKDPVKSDKLALVEGKILNLMFLDRNIPVLPIEVWLRVTHNQRQKTLKVASVSLFRHVVARMWL